MSDRPRWTVHTLDLSNWRPFTGGAFPTGSARPCKSRREAAKVAAQARRDGLLVCSSPQHRAADAVQLDLFAAAA